MSGLDALSAHVNKTYKGLHLVRAGDVPKFDGSARIRTGILSLDLALGGGYPRGKFATIIGEPSSGKTLIALKIMAAFQRHCRNCGKPLASWDELLQIASPITCCKSPEPMRVALYDVETSWDIRWARRVGLKAEEVYLIETEFAEQGLDVCHEALRSGQLDLLVLDSIAFLQPSVEVEKSSADPQYGPLSRLMAVAMKKFSSAAVTSGIGNPKPSILFLNQWRTKLGDVYGDKRSMPGGKAVPQYCHIIAEVKRKGFIGPEDRPEGQDIEVFCPKNKTAPPRRTARFSILIRSGLPTRAALSSDLGQQVIRLGSYWGLIKKMGSWFEVLGQKFQGEAATAAFLERSENRAFLRKLEALIWEKDATWEDDNTSGGVEVSEEEVELPRPKPKAKKTDGAD